jgi:16S rRNA G966 N2-methylase RsmD
MEPKKECAVSPVAYLETGVIECADNLESLEGLPAECVDLIYLDPPFFSEAFLTAVQS